MFTAFKNYFEWRIYSKLSKMITKELTILQMQTNTTLLCTVIHNICFTLFAGFLLLVFRKAVYQDIWGMLGSIIITLVQTYHRVCRQNNFEFINFRSTSSEFMSTSVAAPFFDSQYISSNDAKIKNCSDKPNVTLDSSRNTEISNFNYTDNRGA